MNNLIISYDLHHASSEDYQAVAHLIKQLGRWSKVQKSVWYLQSSFNAKQVASTIYKKMRKPSSLLVVEAIDACSFDRGKSLIHLNNNQQNNLLLGFPLF